MYTHPQWYANRGGKYHLARRDWVQSGRAACGADIRSPALTFKDDAAFRQAASGRHMRIRCKRCVKHIDYEV